MGVKIVIGENILYLRKLHKYTQEEIAEKVGVSRQTVAKWENNESVPDMVHGNKLARVFNVSLDDIVNFESDMISEIGPKGKYIFGTVKIGAEGTIQIPEKARKMFHLSQGTELVVLGDITQGLALIDANQFFEHLDILRRQAKQEV